MLRHAEPLQNASMQQRTIKACHLQLLAKLPTKELACGHYPVLQRRRNILRVGIAILALSKYTRTRSFPLYKKELPRDIMQNLYIIIDIGCHQSSTPRFPEGVRTRQCWPRKGHPSSESHGQDTTPSQEADARTSKAGKNAIPF